MNISAVIFDMDGLMVDTEPLSRRAWEQVVGLFGVVLDDAVYGRMIGRRFDESAQMVLDAYDLPLTRADLMARKSTIFDAIRTQGVPVMPGLRELHAAIARRGLPWAVATSSPRRHAQEILAQLALDTSCRAIAGGDEVARGKPAPDIYLLAAERLGVASANCLALEDSVPGCQAAARAGMVTVVIPNGETKMAVFPCARYQFDSLHEVVSLLDAL